MDTQRIDKSKWRAELIHPQLVDEERCAPPHPHHLICVSVCERDVTVIHTKPEGPALLFSPTPHQQLPWKPISQTHSPSLLAFFWLPFILAALITSHNLFYQCYPLSHLCSACHLYPLHFAVVISVFFFYPPDPLPVLIFWFRLWEELTRLFTAAQISTSPFIHFRWILFYCVQIHISISPSCLIQSHKDWWYQKNSWAHFPPHTFFICTL